MFERKSVNLYLYILLYIFGSILLFILAEKSPSIGDNSNLIERRIESPVKLFFNGYLGVFGNVMYVGIVSWLFIPLCGLFYFKNRTIARSQFTLIIFIFLCVFLIALKGYFNERYQLTTLPVILMLCIYFIVNTVSLKFRTIILFFHLAFTLIAFSFYFKTNFYKKFISNEPTVISIQDGIPLVTDLIKYSGDSLSNYVFIVDNVPEFYYQNQNVKGYYYSSLTDVLFLPIQKRKLIPLDNILANKLFDSLKVDFFLTTIKSFENNPEFVKFIKVYFKVISKDENGMLLLKRI